MKLDKGVCKRFGANCASVWAFLCKRADHATLIDGDKRYFFSPIGRHDTITEFTYRPMIDRLPWMAEQTIRDCVSRIEGEGMVEVWRKADKRAFVRNAEGHRTQTRTHCYHVPDSFLEDLRSKKKSEFVFFSDQDAKAHGVNSALVLQEMRYLLGQARVKDVKAESVVISLEKLAKRLPISKSSIRRAIKDLILKAVLISVGDTGYKLSTGEAVKLEGTRWSKKQVAMPVEQEASVTGGLYVPAIPNFADNFVPTGLAALDSKIREFQKGQLGFVFGYTGHGKTALMMQMALGAARSGKKALVISLEENRNNLAFRSYANAFCLEYTKLFLGDEAEHAKLKKCIEDLSESERVQLIGLQIVEHAGTKATVAELKAILTLKAKQGYCPDVVFVDQFSYLKPAREANTSWENEQKIAEELNGWASSSLQGPHPFALWVLAQAKGEPSKAFNRDSICGRKEIIQPASLAIGIGHTDEDKRKLTLFSLKVRHNASFGLTFNCDFSRMQIDRDMGAAANLTEDKLVLAS